MAADAAPRVLLVDDDPVIVPLREDSACGAPAVVFVSARGQDEDRARGYALGVEYVTKPFDPADLVAIVRRAVAGGGA